MAWGNLDDVDYDDQNIETVGNGTLRVTGLTTLNGGLSVQPNAVGSIGVGSDFDQQNPQPTLNLVGEAAGGRVEAGFNFQDQPNSIVLRVNTNADNGDVIISHRDNPAPLPQANMIVACPRFRVGSPADGLDPAQPGHIDANGTAAEPLDLRIGTRDVTREVHISRLFQAILLNERVRFTTDAAGNANIILNGHEAQNINDPLARGIADNPLGHPEWGGVGPSVDHYFNGQVRWFEDWNGVHNVPVP